jgi:hypothetical protein
VARVLLWQALNCDNAVRAIHLSVVRIAANLWDKQLWGQGVRRRVHAVERFVVRDLTAYRSSAQTMAYPTGCAVQPLRFVARRLQSPNRVTVFFLHC